MASTAKKRKAPEDSGWLFALHVQQEPEYAKRFVVLKSEPRASESRNTTGRPSPPLPKAPRALRDGDHKRDRPDGHYRDSDRDRPAKKRTRFEYRKEFPKVEQDSKPSRDVNDSKQPNGDGRAGDEMEDVKSGEKTVAKDIDEDPLTAELKRVMGFKSFKSTKNTKVAGNEGAYAVRIDKNTKYRQYMNRKGGFNRPLSPS